ncbi:MAG: hypothetical protein AMJ81_11575 [Phycisphaerae bacterium SM23_33]|nr:MAG: hypothetical protein AMJ81_11575 [Phycisphaerae bacterium SM23_33]
MLTKATQVLLPLLAAMSLLLASCETSFDKEDREFCQTMRASLAGDLQKQAEMLSAAEKQVPSAEPVTKVPSGFVPWWKSKAGDKLFADSEPAKHSLDDLLGRALINSAQIKVFSDIPLIRQTGIQEARGEFDTHAFVESTYGYTNEPAGYLLLGTTGSRRYKSWETTLEGGLRKKLVTGADVQVSQQFVRINDNALARVPDPQAYARLALNINQPLLKGGGIKYNRSFIRIAKVDSEVARNEFVRQAEAHLLEIVRAYWNLYMARAVYVQKTRLVAATAELTGKLEKRKDIDAIQSELERARSALAKRKADVVRVEMAIKNAEDRIKALTNDPELLKSTKAELLPTDDPSVAEMRVEMKDCATTALENRPEIAQAFFQIKSAAIRKEMAENELLPQLDLILETSISGVDRAGALTAAWDEEWEAHPGFLVGLRFDFPIENNAAKARLLRRRLEQRQLLNQLRTTVDTVLLEVKISARELQTGYREMQSRYGSLLAAQKDLEVLEKRWESHAGAEAKGAIGYLQLLIDAQDRLAQAEEDFTRSAAAYNVAMVNLQRAQGTLLKYDDLTIAEKEDQDGLPVLQLQKSGQTPSATPVKQ